MVNNSVLDWLGSSFGAHPCTWYSSVWQEGQCEGPEVELMASSHKQTRLIDVNQIPRNLSTVFHLFAINSVEEGIMASASFGCENVPLDGWNFEPGQDHLPSDSSNSDIAGIGVSQKMSNGLQNSRLANVHRLPSDSQQQHTSHSFSSSSTISLAMSTLHSPTRWITAS